jgi:hypothetical protein
MLAFSAVRVSKLSRISAVRSASVQDPCRANSRASSEMASGRDPASPTTSATPPRSPAARGASRMNISCACCGGSTSSSTGVTEPGRSPRCRRLVTRTRHPLVPGSSGATWLVLVALSNTSSARCPAILSRHIPARPSRSPGRNRGSTLAAVSSPASASSGRTGSLSGVCACKSMNSCRSGNWSRSACAACIASAVLPTPGMPSIARTATTPPVPAAPAAAATWPSSSSRPVNATVSGGREYRTSGAAGTGGSLMLTSTPVCLKVLSPCA